MESSDILSDIESDIECESVTSKNSEINLSDIFDENDLLHIEYEVYQYIKDFMETDIIQISNPSFQQILSDLITDVIFDACHNVSGQELNYNDVQQFVDQRIDVYTQTIMTPRSYAKSIILNENIPIEILNEKIYNIRTSFQPLQRTLEWYEYRHNLMTASNIGKIIGSCAKKNSFIYEKCQPLVIHNRNSITNTSSPMHWGVKYETVSIMIYEDIYKTKIEDFGCIQHPDIDCLGSSPDGINVDPTNPRYCRMLEVKNIVNRDITGIPLHDYWVQCQIQLEVCNLDECDFIETRIKEYQKDDFYNDKSHQYKGVVLQFVSMDQSVSYQYMPISEIYEESQVLNWIQQTKQLLALELSLHDTLFWYLDEVSVVLIPRNKMWFKAFLPIILETWDIIKYERINGFSHRIARKKNSTCVIKLNYDDTS
jgi:putative phage-type endonuclease